MDVREGVYTIYAHVCSAYTRGRVLCIYSTIEELLLEFQNSHFYLDAQKSKCQNKRKQKSSVKNCHIELAF
jgi:hypothetical protein